MKVAVIHADHWNDRQGGGELTSKYWIEQGIKQGLDIDLITNRDTNPSLEYDLFILSNFHGFQNKKYLHLVTNTQKYGIWCHNSLPWDEYLSFYPGAEFVVTLAPSHAKKIGVINDNIQVHLPYVDYESFKPLDDEIIPNTELYLGLIHPLKIQKSMIRYIINNPFKQFIFAGELRPEFKFRAKNLHFIPPVSTPLEVNKIMNKYSTFFWYLDRYGCYGRTLVEAMLVGMDLNVNKSNFGLFEFDWANGKSREAIIEALEKDLQTFWWSILTNR